MKDKQSILVTGAAGFIGFHLSQLLLSQGFRVVGLDSFNDYYDVGLKKSRNQLLVENENFISIKGDITDKVLLPDLFNKYSFNYVVNLAAQAGVRYSLVNPFAYTESNITGFVNILENCVKHQVKHLVFASSSSVYGANKGMPFAEKHHTEHPVSLYAATKKANELIAHSYANSFGLPVTGLRFFTVYGPWGRPDMALFLFTKAILEGKPIEVFNNGHMLRDFTYVRDIVTGVAKVMELIPQADPDWDPMRPAPDKSFLPYSIYNIGNNQPVALMDFIHAIENELGKKASIDFKPIQKGDVPETYADTQKLENAIGFRPSTPVQEGIHEFVKWYKQYYKI